MSSPARSLSNRSSSWSAGRDASLLVSAPAAHLAASLHRELQRAVPADLYDIWLAPVQVQTFDGERLVQTDPAPVAGWVRDRLGAALRTAAERVLGTEHPLAITLHTGDPGPAGPHAAPAQPPVPATPADRPLHPKYTFEQFVIGNANRFAHAAALSAAELPGSAYNPLLIVGPPGVGKTHLLHSIGNYVLAYGSGLTVRYTTAEDFTNEFRAALDRKSTASFKAHYRHADVLLIDDIQFLAHKTRTEEEFFHTFNALRESGSQIVMSADRPPREMDGLEQRLCQRFESGLLVEIGAPDLAMRQTILRKRAAVDGLDIDDRVLDLIAERVTDTVRALEAALIRIAAYASLTDEPITPELTDRVLRQLYGREQTRRTRSVSVVEIQELVAAAFDLTTEELLSSARTARIAWPRQLAMLLAREHTGQSLPAIGTSFGGRDHTTVLHACRRAKARLADDPAAAGLADQLRDRLRSGDSSDRLP